MIKQLRSEEYNAAKTEWLEDNLKFYFLKLVCKTDFGVLARRNFVKFHTNEEAHLSNDKSINGSQL